MHKPIAICVTCDNRPIDTVGQGALHKMHGHIVQAPDRAERTREILNGLRDSIHPRLVQQRALQV